MSTLRRHGRSALGLLHRVARRTRDNRPAALTAFLFHEVTDSPSTFERQFGLAVPNALFRDQIAWIRKHYTVIDPRALLDGSRLPPRAALITFDDGSRGAVTKAIPWLIEQEVPSVMFLNMRPVLERRPLLSALVMYLDHHDPRFGEFARGAALPRPFYLHATPEHLAAFELRHGPIDLETAKAYAGSIATFDEVRFLENSPYVVFGSHLFDHWNAAALSLPDLTDQFERNRSELERLRNYVPLFAFPNGQPGSCWTNRDVEVVRRLGARRAFAAAGGVNPQARTFLLGRIAVGPDEDTPNRLWYAELRARRQQAALVPETGSIGGSTPPFFIE